MPIDYTIQTRDRPFAEHATLRSGLMAYWGFNGTEAIGSTSAYYNWDSTGVYHLQCSAGAPLPQQNSRGVPSLNLNPIYPYYVNAYGLQFDAPGTGNKFDLTTTDFRFSGDFSVSLWSRRHSTDQPDSDRNYIRATAGANRDWAIYAANTSYNLKVEIWDSSSGSETVTKAHDGTNDTHFVAVYDATAKTVTFYANGSGTASSALTNGLRQGSTTLEIYDTQSGLRWMFDEIGVWNRKLTAQEITDLGSPLLYSSPNPTGSA